MIAVGAATLPAHARVLLPGVERLLVVAGQSAGPAGLDAAIGPALLRRVARGHRDAWLRWYRPEPTVGFSGLDLLAPGVEAAVAAARAHGFTPVRRAPGGRAAAYHRTTLCMDLVLPTGPDAPAASRQLQALGTLLVDALLAWGVDARLGPVPGEYCPGAFSVNAGGRVKLVGTAARRTSGATLISAVLPVTDAGPLREVIDAVYRALPLSCDPQTVAALSDLQVDTEITALVGHLTQAVARGAELTTAGLPAEVLTAGTAELS